ncbi:acetyltransferase [Vibrio fortis]|uniref:Acetyltransferase n=1 Tax=Vibrio fortis TaxID=212667 RepID=A0A5N3R226_9VIBR|nr:acetyltransferase [Vibrio fortis]KAB0287465.1 acetyltransferase [Vibrio fortis]
MNAEKSTLNKQRIVIIGGAGNGMVFAQVILDMQKSGHPLILEGFLNDHHACGEVLGEWPVLGKPADWNELDDDIQFVFALLTVGKMEERAELLHSLAIPLNRMTTLVHPSAMVGFDTQIGKGSVICSHASIQPGARIGNNTIVRAGANVGHDVTLSDCIDIGPNVTLCGFSSVKDGAHVAANSVVRDSITVGPYAVIGAGSVILKDADSRTTWLGNPARRVK